MSTFSKFIVNPSGQINLKNGKTKWFNILEEWEQGSMTLVLCSHLATKKYRLIAGAKGSYSKLGDELEMVSNEHTRMGQVRILGHYQNTQQDLTHIMDMVKTNNIHFSTFD